MGETRSEFLHINLTGCDPVEIKKHPDETDVTPQMSLEEETLPYEYEYVPSAI